MFTVVLSLVLVALVTAVARKAFSKFSALQELPGPPNPSILVGNALHLAKSRIGTRFNVWAKQYGHAYKLDGPLMEPWLMLTDPKGLSYILSGKNYVRPEGDRRDLELFFGRGLFCAEGEEHKNMRKMLNPSFTSRSIQEVSHVFFDLAYRLKTQWEDKLGDGESAVFDVSSSLHMLSLDAITMTMFMHDMSTTDGNVPTLLHNITKSFQHNSLTILIGVLASSFPIIMTLPSPMKRWTDQLRTELGVIAEEVWAGKDSAGMHAKLLESIGQYEKTSDKPTSKEEAIAQIIGLIFAGSETSANIIAESFYELSRNHDVQEKLRQELSSFEGTHGFGPTSYDNLMNPTVLPYLDAFTREIMRTKAVVVDISRAAVEDDVIPLQFPIVSTGATQLRVRAGQLIIIPIREGVNTDEDIWGSTAEEFRPERWIEEDGLPDSTRLLSTQGHLLTFGDGPKACLGRAFALAEFKIVVSVMVRHFSFETDGSTIDFYRRGGNMIRPMVRTREAEGVQMPLRVRRV